MSKRYRVTLCMICHHPGGQHILDGGCRLCDCPGWDEARTGPGWWSNVQQQRAERTAGIPDLFDSTYSEQP